MLCSTFRHPFYPYKGADSGNDHIINVPLAARTSGTEFREAVTEHWLPALERFQPEFLFISAGFDAHYEDDMGGLGVERSRLFMGNRNLEASREKTPTRSYRICLEGGYSLHALGRCVMTHIKSLSEL